MTISVRVVANKGAIRKTVTRLGVLSLSVRKGARALSPETVKAVIAIVTVHDYLNFKSMQVKQENNITLPTAIFSRVTNRIGMDPYTTIRKLEQKVDWILPLDDTGRLRRSISEIQSPDMKIRVTVATITILNLVPYYRKHATGFTEGQSRTEDFTFGAKEKRRLKERVPPPPKGKQEIIGKNGIGERRGAYRNKVRPSFYEGGDIISVRFIDPETGRVAYRTRQKKGKLLFREAEAGDLKTSRPYYRLRNWAEKRYPISAKMKARAWLKELYPEEIQVIQELIMNDILEKFGASGNE